MEDQVNRPIPTPRDVIRAAPALVAELREFRIATDPAHPVHPEICDRAADALAKFLELGEVMMAGRHAFNNLNIHGAAILDFFNCWLDQARDEIETLKRERSA